MKITITANEAEFDKTAAQAIIDQIENKPDSVIGLSTGRTTGNMHRLVAKHYTENPKELGKLTMFGLDEVVGVPLEYFGSCYTMLMTEIIGSLNLAEGNFLMLPVSSDDYDRDCKAFADELKARGGIDLLMLGLGENGHLGFNQPGADLDCTAHVEKMNIELERRIRKEISASDDAYLAGATLGIREIMSAKRIILVAKGSNKAEIVKQMLQGPVTSDVPASILQKHPDCEFLLDEASAVALDK